MCGRARCTLRADDIPRACHRTDAPVRSLHIDRYRPSFNVSPGANVPVVRREDGSAGEGIVLHCMKWGLIPSFTKKAEKPDFYRMFNARSESVAEKASFRRLLPKSRCLVAVEGFYEWKKDGLKKQPYYIHFKDGRPLVFAALYDSWQNSEGEILYTFTILTTSSSSALNWLHDRMPVILGDKGSTDAWLDGSSSNFNTLLKPYEDSDLVWYPVTPAMGKPSFDGPECVKEIQLKAEEKNPLLKFFSAKDVKKEHESGLEEKVKKEQESGLEEKTSDDESHKTTLPEGVKEETETEDNMGTPPFNGEGDRDSKSSVCLLPREGIVKSQIKREREELLTDSKLSASEVEKPSTSPARKKGNLKGAGDKQPTLLSYYGKR